MLRRRHGFIVVVCCLLAPGPWRAYASGQDLRLPLSESDGRAAASVTQEMREDARGPYLRIRWYCADGTVHAPAGTPCRERGGGVQHAEPNEAARRLAALGVHTGTLLQGLTWEAFWDAPNDHHRLKAFLLEHYLSEVDDGWVLRRARYYRGARQIEDEEKRGQTFLERLLADPAWTRRHFLLASQLVSVVPSLTPGRRVSTPAIRNLATELAARDERFQALRVKIHSFPGPADLDTVEAVLATDAQLPAVRESLTRLRDALRGQYDTGRWAQQVASLASALGPSLADELAAVQGTSSLARLASVARLAYAEVVSSRDGSRNLVLMHLIQLLQQRAFVLAQEPSGPADPPATHLVRLEALGAYLSLAGSAGFLSEREHDALVGDLAWLRRTGELGLLDYRARLDYLASGLDWAMATATHLFGPSVRRYAQVEPKAAGFLDALIRGSILLPLANRLDDLTRDLNRRLGQSHVILGERVEQGVAGLNPGVALRPLEILQPGSGPQGFDAGTIYVLPELPSEMGPVAGILTLDQGNLLSHVQLLARNLGIPNASIPGALLPRLQAYRGREVFLAVSPLGQVVLKDPTQLTEADRALIDDSRAVRTERLVLNISRLRLDATRPIPLTDLGADDAGVTVGPKAANLGELARRFPGHVAPGLALPFGMYVRHVDRPFPGGPSLHEAIQRTFRKVDALRDEGRTEEEIDRITLDRLAELRQAIVDLEWAPAMRQAIVDGIQQTFGDDLSRGVFIRSDTNVEDLPQFTGAGLNLTVAHQTTEAAVLEAIKAVWASPFRERPYRWRKQILESQVEVYPSVLLLQSVASDKSGVLITSGLQAGGADAVTIVTAEGVGGGVDGEPAETLLVARGTGPRLLSQAKAPYHRVLADAPAGGIHWRPSARRDTLLAEDEVRQLVRTIDVWRRALPNDQQSVVWDMEFGFASGRLWLFQIRPFVPYRSVALHERLLVLDDDLVRQSTRTIDLAETYAIP